MVKQISILLLIALSLNANSFKENCLECHQNEFQLAMFMKKYTLKYSSEKRVKKALYSYLKNPTFNKSVLPYGFLKRFGIKNKSTLDDKELQNMIDLYYNQYNIKSKIY